MSADEERAEPSAEESAEESSEQRDPTGTVSERKTEESSAAARGAAGTDRSRYRRLHTLSGALALGVFLVEHLLTNASALGGHAAYDSVVGAIERSKVLPIIEIVFIVLPLGFHAGYGVHLLRQKAAAAQDIERYGDRRFWILQRISAVVVLVFVLGHLWELRVQRLLFGLSADAFYTTLTAHLSWTWASVPWIALFYFAGIFAVAVHFANGLFAATAAWQIWTSAAGRKRMRVLTVGLGLVLGSIGGATVVGLATGTRLLPGADDDSAPPRVPCGSAALAPPPPFKLPPAPSR